MKASDESQVSKPRNFVARRNTRSYMNQTKTPKYLACLNCREKRRKCSLDRPCASCVDLGIECISPPEDLRRKRYPASYVKSLESHIAFLESTFNEIKTAGNSERREQIIGSMNIDDLVIELNGFTAEDTPSDKDAPKPQTIKDGNYNEPFLSSQHGVQDSILDLSSKAKRGQLKHGNLATTKEIHQLARSPMILRAISLFFQYLYPGHYMFIHRESFLESFFNHTSHNYYCSVELVYAIAANGARIADRSDELFAKSRYFYNMAKKPLLSKIFELEENLEPADHTDSDLFKVTELQALLCLAFYDIGNGKDSLGWYLSGLSFRVSHEVGLHLDPKNWSDSERAFLEVRSRIYWGCYIADHLICLFFGRTAQLRLSNSTMPETNDLPDVESEIEEYQYSGASGRLPIAEAMKKLIVLSRITEVFYQTIFVENSSKDQDIQRYQILKKFNIEVYSWRKNLPVDFFWDKGAVEISNADPTVTYFWYHYYIVVLSFNKPFLSRLEQSRVIVQEVVEDIVCLLTSFRREFHGGHNKCNLYMVYAAILSLECLNLIQERFKENTATVELDEVTLQEETAVLTRFLNASSGSYKLSKSFVDNEMKINSMGFVGLMSRDYLLHHDLTLLREIDKLISENKRCPPDLLEFLVD